MIKVASIINALLLTLILAMPSFGHHDGGGGNGHRGSGRNDLPFTSQVIKALFSWEPPTDIGGPTTDTEGAGTR